MDEPDELENVLTLHNCFWHNWGSLMQQGSDIAPKYVIFPGTVGQGQGLEEYHCLYRHAMLKTMYTILCILYSFQTNFQNRLNVIHLQIF